MANPTTPVEYWEAECERLRRAWESATDARGSTVAVLRERALAEQWQAATAALARAQARETNSNGN